MSINMGNVLDFFSPAREPSRGHPTLRLSLALPQVSIALVLFALGCGDEAPDESLISPWSDLEVGRDQRTTGTCVAFAAEPPSALSDHPCYAGSPPAPGTDMVYYEPGAPLWSDNAYKERFVALPADAQMVPTRSGDIDFPIGTVLVKRFFLHDRPIEERIMELDEDGVWQYYTYVWNEDATDARLSDGETVTFAGTEWGIPTQQQCLDCHTAAAGESLGLEIPLLNFALTYPSSGREGHQLATLAALGMLDVSDLDHPSTLDVYTNNDPRAYLHTNCANCHRPGGAGAGQIDLRATTELQYTNLCADDEYGDLTEGEDGRIIVPGDPERSILLARMKSTSSLWRMPTVGSVVVDDHGVALIEAWIRDLEACE